MPDFPVPVFLAPLLFFLLALWPLLIIWLFDFLFGFKSRLTGTKLVLVWFIIHSFLNVLALSWSNQLNQEPSLSFENIILSFTHWCKFRNDYGCVYGTDFTGLIIMTFLSTIPGLFIFYWGVKSKR